MIYRLGPLAFLFLVDDLSAVLLMNKYVDDTTQQNCSLAQLHAVIP